MRLLLVDDDAGLRSLLRTTFELVDVDLVEAAGAEEAERLAEERPPDVVVLDLGMPGIGGAELYRRLRRRPATRDVPVILLSGNDEAARIAGELGVEAFLAKPFSPLQLLAVAERLAGRPAPMPTDGPMPEGPEAQLLLYARDLRRMLEAERGRRDLLQMSFRDLLAALAAAAELRSGGGHGHPERVRRYALELTRVVEPSLAREPGLEYGFLLHDVGMTGIPDEIVRRTSPLAPDERRILETHPLLGAQLLSGVALLRGEGIAVVRSHHERWDGRGYPDALQGHEIPLGARIFAVADALDSLATGRSYRPALPWHEISRTIEDAAEAHFDPAVVAGFLEASPRLRALAGAVPPPPGALRR